MRNTVLTAPRIAARLPQDKKTCMHSEVREELRMKVPDKWHKKEVILVETVIQ